MVEDFALLNIVQQVAWLLLAAAVIGMVARRFGIPYAIALVIGGLLIEESHVLPVPELEPSLVLFVFLPPLLFDAAFRAEVDHLKAWWRPILLLAAPGVLGTAAIAGVLLAAVLGLPLTVGLLFGAIVAATDAVAVVAIFRQLKAPVRLTAIAEGESLFNDGMAITLYIALLGAALGSQFELGPAVVLFGREVLGGALIGAVTGLAVSRLTALADDHLIEMTLSTALAYGSYLIAQAVEASGPLACVAAGLIHGSYGREVGLSEQSRDRLDDLWEYLGFLANGFLFLLVGLSVNVRDLITHAWPVAVAIVAVLLARGAMIALPAWLARPSRRALHSWGERVVLTWGGLRGALTLALALALPDTMPARDLLIAMAFGVVLFTLIVQGLTLPLVMRGLGVARRDPAPAHAE